MNLAHTANVSRLIAAATAGVITFTLFSGVVSISEPQRGQLMALNQKHQAVTLAKAAPATPAEATRVASADRADAATTVASR